MSEFTNAEIRRLDLTLLLIFLGLVRHRKAQDVANEIGLTQSAISQALKRLRDIFGDELFIRRPHGLEPTAVALALEAPISEAVETLRGALGRTQVFDPATATGVVRLAAPDAEQTVIVPKLATFLKANAPGLQLSVVPLARADAIEALNEGRVDLSLGFIWEYPDVISKQDLYEEGFLVAGDAELIGSGLSIDLEAYCAVDHVLVTGRGDLHGIVDEQLEALGKARRVAVSIPGFLPALAVAASRGALVTLPERIVRSYAPAFGLSFAPPPLEVRRFPVSVYWHRRDEADPKRRWLTSALMTLTAAPSER